MQVRTHKGRFRTPFWRCWQFPQPTPRQPKQQQTNNSADSLTSLQHTMILRFKLYSMAVGATAFISTPSSSNAFTPASQFTSSRSTHHTTSDNTSSTARPSSLINPDWDNSSYMESLGGTKEQLNDTLKMTNTLWWLNEGLLTYGWFKPLKKSISDILLNMLHKSVITFNTEIFLFL